MSRTRLYALTLAGATLIAACGGSGSTSASGGGSAYGASAPATTPAPGHGAAIVTTRRGAPGTFLVDGQGRALYLWDADDGSTSTCSGACAQAWPPLTTTGKPAAGSGVEASLLGTTKRADGSTEVTYKGHPLYYFAGDQSAGQTNGQGSDGFGAKWYLVKASGSAIDED
jgi:predicted lipoprotein with Yx(FWY)xxD motif